MQQICSPTAIKLQFVCSLCCLRFMISDIGCIHLNLFEFHTDGIMAGYICRDSLTFGVVRDMFTFFPRRH